MTTNMQINVSVCVCGVFLAPALFGNILKYWSDRTPQRTHIRKSHRTFSFIFFSPHFLISTSNNHWKLQIFFFQFYWFFTVESRDLFKGAVLIFFGNCDLENSVFNWGKWSFELNCCFSMHLSCFRCTAQTHVRL